MIAIRRVHGLLFAFGLMFAPFAWILLPLPIGILLPEYRYSGPDVALSVSGALLAASGYMLWLGWLRHASTGLFPLQCPKTFFAIVYLHHLGWLCWFPYMRGTNVFEFASNAFGLFLWITANAAFAPIGFSVAVFQET
ncbi:MAG TPA: hypothetical protein VM510_15955 [Caulifigura sp.]|nr:hypothetical protein [Caulifigura sp.]